MGRRLAVGLVGFNSVLIIDRSVLTRENLVWRVTQRPAKRYRVRPWMGISAPKIFEKKRSSQRGNQLVGLRENP